MTLLETIQEKLSLIAALFVLVFTAGVGVSLLDERMQGGIKYFIGSVCIGLAVGGLAMAFTDHAGIVLGLGIAGMATAPATIVWLQHKTLLDVIKEARNQRNGDGDGEGGADG
ncbi:MAG: hypothetical protein ACJAUS_002475 [Qipengyuania sp.]|jgi:hypothetical protein